LSSNLANGRASKRRRLVVEESDDEYALDQATEEALANDGGFYL
jgi:hypothetical protein